jgi:hypothetical protein
MWERMSSKSLSEQLGLFREALMVKPHRSRHGRAERPVRPKAARQRRRDSLVIFNERDCLLRVLDSIERTLPAGSQRAQEVRMLEAMIYARTLELDRLNPSYDEKITTALRIDTSAGVLDRLAREAPPTDVMLLRLISQHPNAAPETLRRLARHPSALLRENIARHPHTDTETLVRLARQRNAILWSLIARHPNAPSELRRRLEERLGTEETSATRATAGSD